MTDSHRPTPAERRPDRMLTAGQVCERLGISRSPFYDWRQAHKAPPCPILPNNQTRIRASDLDAWVQTQMEPA